jgi:hypothetical protein
MAANSKDIIVSPKPSDLTSSRGSNEDDNGDGELHMTRAKWLAILSLALLYTTSFQQGACLGAIVKSIDEALGKSLFQAKSGSDKTRSQRLLQLDGFREHDNHVDISPALWWSL